MKTLVGINGKKYSGKDTTGNFLSEITGFNTYALAKPLKNICSKLFGFTEEQLYGNEKEDVIKIMLRDWKHELISVCRDYFAEFIDEVSDEKLTSEFYRTVLLPYMISENSSIDQVCLIISARLAMQGFGTNFIQNKIDKEMWIKLGDREYNNQKSLIVTDIRYDHEAQWIKSRGGIVVSILRDTDYIDSHSSEQGISNNLIDVKIDNNGTLDELKNGVEVLYNYNLQSPTVSLNDFL